MGLTLVRHTQPDVIQGTCYGRMDLPLQRCRLLAQKIGTAFELDVQIDDRLREMDFGSWEGQLWDDIGVEQIDNWNNNFYQARPHGGESVEMLVERVHSALNDYRRSSRSHIVVCHSGVIKAATSTGTKPTDFSANVGFGAFVHLD